MINLYKCPEMGTYFSDGYIKLNNSGDGQIQSLRREKMIPHFRNKIRNISVTQGTSRSTLVENFIAYFTKEGTQIDQVTTQRLFL
jgi:hypothetical protein